MKSFVLEGLVDGVGTVLTFLPVILVFFVAMALVEDSGYLVRVAFLMDRWMAKLGLDGRAFVMQLMGMGCNVPAIMGTRVLRSRGSRLLAMLAIPFSLCSARLQVLVFIAAAFFSRQGAAPLVLASLYASVSSSPSARRWCGAGASPATSRCCWRCRRTGCRRCGRLFAQGWQSSRHFLENAGGFIVAGCC